jgi:hypothetical protein
MNKVICDSCNGTGRLDSRTQVSIRCLMCCGAGSTMQPDFELEEIKAKALAMNRDLIIHSYSAPKEWAVVDSGTGKTWGWSQESELDAWNSIGDRRR